MTYTMTQPATTTIWQSKNKLWTIQRNDYVQEGVRHAGTYTITDGRQGCTTYAINERYIEHIRHMLSLGKTHQIPVPMYVCRAILRNVEGA